MLPRTKAEIEDVIGEAIDAEMEGSKFPGMTYEQGVQAALQWVTGQSDDNPMAE
jgi:hypothetical protein